MSVRETQLEAKDAPKDGSPPHADGDDPFLLFVHKALNALGQDVEYEREADSESDPQPNVFWIRSASGELREFFFREDATSAAINRLMNLLPQYVPESLAEAFTHALHSGSVTQLDGSLVTEAQHGAVAFGQALCRSFAPTLLFEAEYFDPHRL